MHNQQKAGMEEYGNSRKFYGTMIIDNGKSGHNFSFDDMSAEHKEVHIKRRSMSSVADPEEEERD